MKDWEAALLRLEALLGERTRELRESEARFRRLAETDRSFVFRYETHPAAAFTYVSQTVTEILGYPPEEWYADPYLAVRLTYPGDLPWLEMLDGDACRQGVTFKAVRRDGQLAWLEHRDVAIRDTGRRVIAYEGIVRDVTEQKRLEERLLRAQRLETAGRIAGQVAHDFNNLLSPLVAFPDLIEMELPEGHPAARYCQAMRESACRMADINQDLLALGRRGSTAQQPTDLNRLVRQAVATSEDWPKSLAVDVTLAPELPAVGGSPSQLLRVISNLVGNAREAMRDAGRLTLRTEDVHVDRPFGCTRIEEGDYVRLTVGDTGCGIPLEIRERIFDAFFTTKRSDSKRGSGLGLSVVQAIVEDHRGCIDLESQMGRGTTFRVYLPVCPEPEREESKNQLPRGTESVLVVDDDPLQRQVAERLLDRLGYRVATATGGEEALVQLATRPADLLVLDMVMPPGIDGAETYRRALDLRPGQRAIIVSGFAESERVREAQALGAGPLVGKPLSLEKLALAVREALDRFDPGEPGALATESSSAPIEQALELCC